MIHRYPEVQSVIRGMPPKKRTIKLPTLDINLRRNEKSGVLPPGAKREPITRLKPYRVSVMNSGIKSGHAVNPHPFQRSGQCKEDSLVFYKSFALRRMSLRRLIKIICLDLYIDLKLII